MYDIGIDYSNGMSNIDFLNNIHYGVINQNEVLQVWCDSSEPYYGDTVFCDECQSYIKLDDVLEMDSCPICGNTLSFDFIEPISWFIDDNEYQAECSDDYGDIFITKSPYYTTCQYCSPCAPGAGYIMNTVKNGVKTYCFGHDFFENEKAPYPIYSVETGELIEAE